MLTAAGPSVQKVSCHFPFALDFHRPPALKDVVVGVQDLVQVTGHLRDERQRIVTD